VKLTHNSKRIWQKKENERSFDIEARMNREQFLPDYFRRTYKAGYEHRLEKLAKKLGCRFEPRFDPVYGDTLVICEPHDDKNVLYCALYPSGVLPRQWRLVALNLCKIEGCQKLIVGPDINAVEDIYGALERDRSRICIYHQAY
jgi:hypothetical protein